MSTAPITWTVSEQLRWVAGRHAQATAIVDETGSLTFDAFYRRVQALAGHLRPLAGRRVGIYMGNRREWAETFFACHLAGVGVVPVNDRYQNQEVHHLVTDGDVALVVSDGAQHRGDVLTGLSGTVDTLVVGPAYERALREAPGPRPTWNDESAVLYTSGTTAKAKGVRLTQANQFRGSFLGPAVLLAVTAADTVLIATPLGHRVGQVRLLGGILTGGRTVLISDSRPATLVDAIENHRVTVTGMVPTIARDLSYSGVDLRRRFESLRVLSVTGEAMTADLRTRVARMLPDTTELWTFFASTETGLVTALNPHEFTSRPSSSGRAIPGIEIAVMDLESGSVGDAGEGEVLVRSGAPGSYAVAEAYVGAAAASPFVDEGGWFHTGDIGVIEDGWLAITGRSKDMILSGGFNIAAQEVEDVLRQHPGVRDVAVTGEPDDRFGERVVAWIVSHLDTPAPSETELREFTGERIAAFKRPRVLHFITEIPRTATGKVAKWQLADGTARVGHEPRTDDDR